MRKAAASLLMSLLVAMTSWASACDLSCSLERAHSACKLDGTVTASTPQATPRALAGQAQPKSEMAMGPAMERAMEGAMVMPDETALTQADAGAPHLHSNSCTHSPCNETSISAISKSAARNPVRVLPAIAFVRPIISSSFGHASSIVATPEPPDLQPFDPLSVSLRI